MAFFTPGFYLIELRDPQDRPNPPQAVCWDLLPRPRSPARIERRLNTFDPYDNDDAVFLHIDDAKDHDTKEALHNMGNLAKNVVT